MVIVAGLLQFTVWATWGKYSCTLATRWKSDEQSGSIPVFNPRQMFIKLLMTISNFAIVLGCLECNHLLYLYHVALPNLPVPYSLDSTLMTLSSLRSTVSWVVVFLCWVYHHSWKVNPLPLIPTRYHYTWKGHFLNKEIFQESISIAWIKWTNHSISLRLSGLGYLTHRLFLCVLPCRTLWMDTW